MGLMPRTQPIPARGDEGGQRLFSPGYHGERVVGAGVLQRLGWGRDGESEGDFHFKVMGSQECWQGTLFFRTGLSREGIDGSGGGELSKGVVDV